MQTVRAILQRVLDVHYGGVKRRLAEKIGRSSPSVTRWFRSVDGSVPEHAIVRQLEAMHPVEAQGLSAAWERESKQTQRTTRRAPVPPAVGPVGPEWCCSQLTPGQRAQLASLVHDLVESGWDDAMRVVALVARDRAAARGVAPLPTAASAAS